MILILKTVSWHCAAHYLVGTKQHTYTKLTTNSYLATSNANEASASSSVQSRPTLCDPTDCSTAGFPVHHQLPRLLKLMSILSVMPLKHLTLCRPLLLPPSIFPSIRVFSNGLVLQIRWPKYWSFSFSISPSNVVVSLFSDLLKD